MTLTEKIIRGWDKMTDDEFDAIRKSIDLMHPEHWNISMLSWGRRLGSYSAQALASTWEMVNRDTVRFCGASAAGLLEFLRGVFQRRLDALVKSCVVSSVFRAEGKKTIPAKTRALAEGLGELMTWPVYFTAELALSDQLIADGVADLQKALRGFLERDREEMRAKAAAAPTLIVGRVEAKL